MESLLLLTWRITSHLETPLFPQCMESAFVSAELSTWFGALSRAVLVLDVPS